MKINYQPNLKSYLLVRKVKPRQDNHLPRKARVVGEDPIKAITRFVRSFIKNPEEADWWYADWSEEFPNVVKVIYCNHQYYYEHQVKLEYRVYEGERFH